ncbi:MAG: radical SAM protein [Pseudomonadales bacterium]|nr:radical SAM protein [Pseudomonadales bacterium]
MDPVLGKFVDPYRTLDGKPRARVALDRLRTLWFNTGTLCNLQCGHCSSPRNDRLVYLDRLEVRRYLEEISALGLDTEEIGFTGGEPFMNPDLPAMLEDSLARGFRVLVLTNAMRPMMKCAPELLALRDWYGSRLTLRVSIDHYRPELHEEERGPRTWAPTLKGIKWLSDNGFAVAVAGRRRWGDEEASLRAGFARLFQAEGINVDTASPTDLVLFPEMDPDADTPEITTECWDILGVRPVDVMCASSRMVIKRKGADIPEVASCTLLPYDEAFSLGERLGDSLGDVVLNHPHCSRFCVLGGGRCSQ